MLSIKGLVNDLATLQKDEEQLEKERLRELERDVVLDEVCYTRGWGGLAALGTRVPVQPPSTAGSSSALDLSGRRMNPVRGLHWLPGDTRAPNRQTLPRMASTAPNLVGAWLGSGSPN